MKQCSKIILFTSVCCRLLPVSMAAQSLTPNKIYKKVNDAVVRLYSYAEGMETYGQASGVILRSKGWIITNYHILRDDAYVNVTAEHNGKKYLIDSIVSMDPESDVLILQMKDAGEIKKDNSIPEIKVGNSNDLEVGQRIFAIGSPRNFENTMTDGMVSGFRAADDSSKNLIQISAPISPGSSGGAIVNEKAELVGISSAMITTGQNLNFAVPINDVMAAAPGKDAKRGTPETYLKGVALARYQYDKGYRAFMAHDYYLAITCYKKADAAGFKSRTPELYYDEATAYHCTGQDDSAICYLEKAVALEPRFAEAYYSLYQVYLQRKDITKAMENQIKAYQLDPEMRNRPGFGNVKYMNRR